jgi:hypothetical protein
MRKKIPFLKFLSGIFLFLPSLAFSQIWYPPTGSDTTCSNGYFVYHRLYSGNKDDISFDLSSASDSGYVLVGHTKSYGNGAYDGYVIKVNKKGNLLWSKAIGGSGNDVFYSIKRTSDNGFIICGQTKSYGNTAGDAWLVKMDVSGNVEWSKKYGDGNINGEVSYDVTQLSDGGYALCGAHMFSAGVTQGFVVRTDNQGNVMWSKQYGASGSDELWGLTEDGNSLVVVGFYQGSSLYDGYLMKLDKATGAIQMIKGYKAEGRSTMLAKIRKTTGGYQVFSLIMDDYVGGNQQQCIWNLATDGTVQNIRKMVMPASVTTNSYGWQSFQDGSFTVVNGDNSSNSNIIITQVNVNGSIGWSKKYIRSGQQVIRNIILSPEGGYAGAGYNSTNAAIADSNNVYCMRIDSLADDGICIGINTTDVTVATPNYTTPVSAVTDQGTVNINNPVITVGTVVASPATDILCFFCKPRPTGSQRGTNGGTGGIQNPHVIKAYPNPVTNRLIILSIEAKYDDRALISLVDINGNVIYTLNPKDIRKGENSIFINLPFRLQTYTSYFIQTKFISYSSSTKIFVINQ